MPQEATRTRTRPPAKKAATVNPNPGRSRVAPAPNLVMPFEEGDGERTAGFKLRRMALADMMEHPRNAEVRKHPEPGTPAWDTLKASLAHDYFDPLVWNVRNGQLVSGHLRRKVMLHEGLFTHAFVVEVDYDEPTHLARLLAANKGIGRDDLEGQAKFLKELESVGNGFEFNALSGFSFEESDSLVKSFFDSDFGGGDYDGDDGDGGDDDGGEDGGGEAYSTKISAPTYEPKGEQPTLGELADTTKRDTLLNSITAANVPEEVKAFLRLGAARHIVFDYSKIAEYYAHAPAEVQALFEESALVIIDFDQAIEGGYVRLTERMKEVYQLNMDRLTEERGEGWDDEDDDDAGEELEEEEGE